MESPPHLSIIIPFFNEEGNVEPVLKEVSEVMSQQKTTYEIILINDGSSDTTPALLRAAANHDSHIRIITHPVNLGQGAAFFSGFRTAQGDVIVTMDGDGQNDFRDVPAMLPLLPEYDAVFGQRSRRNDPVQKLIASWIGFVFRRIVLGDNVRDTACGLKVMKKEALNVLIPIKGFHRFIPFMFKQAGLTYACIDVHHRPRRLGKTKYSLLRLYFLATIADLLFMGWFRLNRIPSSRKSH